MSLSDEERTIIVGLEIKKASETFEEIEILVAAKRWSGAASRLYYAVFNAVNALLIKDGHMVSSHKGSHGAFGQYYYVTTGVFPPEYGRL